LIRVKEQNARPAPTLFEVFFKFAGGSYDIYDAAASENQTDQTKPAIEPAITTAARNLH
jgi:hypothetical protein